MSGVELKTVELYPNPAKDFIHLTNAKGEGLIYNLSGQLVRSVTLTEEGVNTIDVSQLENGIYQVVLIQETGDRIIKRFIK